MGREYVPIFYDWLETTQDLSDEERGRLINAVILYASGQEYEHMLQGPERIAFRFLKGTIDRGAVISELRSKSGKWKQNEAKPNKREQTEAKPNKREQNRANGNEEEKEEEYEKEKEEEEMTNSACARAEISDDEAFRIQREHDQVLNAAESAGFPRNDIVRARLIGLYARHGKERVLAAITDCAEHSASSIAYLDAILRGGPKKEAAKKLTKPVNAQQYSQRDYSDAQESDEDMVQRLLAGGGGSS